MTDTEQAGTLRCQVARIMALRDWLTRIEANAGECMLGRVAHRLEWELLLVEDELAQTADRLSPPFQPTGKQWIAGLMVPAVKS